MKTFKKILFTFVGAFSVFAAINFYNYAENIGWFGKNKINYETSYLGINIGDSKSDVYFALGKPYFLPDFDRFPNLEDYVLGFHKRDALSVVDYVIFVNIKKNKVIGISASARKNRFDVNMNLKWIKLNAWDFKSILGRLGEPSKVFNLNEGVGRIYHFSKNNIFVGVEDGDLDFIGVGNLYFRDELFCFKIENNPFFDLDYSKK